MWSWHDIEYIEGRYPWAAAAALVCVVAYLFAMVGIAAFDFLCPTLTHLTSKTGFSEALMGVTFIAFGNASVDVVGSFLAIREGSATLAIGSVIGAATFVSGVVVGSLGIQGAFHVERAQFLRDNIFLLVAVLLTLSVVYDGVITGTESTLMALLYVMYAVVVLKSTTRNEVFTSDPERQCDTLRQVGERRMQGLSPSPSSESGNSDSMTGFPPSPNPGQMRHSLFSAIEFRESMHDGSLPPSLWDSSRRSSASGRSCPPLLSATSQEASKDNLGDLTTCTSTPNFKPPPQQLEDAAPNRGRNPKTLPKLQISNHDDDTDSSTTHRRGSQFDHVWLYGPADLRESGNAAPAGPLSEMGHEPHADAGSRIKHLFPALSHWKEKAWTSKVNSVLMTPAILVLASSIPIAETNVDVSLLKMHSVVSPLTVQVLCFPISLLSLALTATISAACLYGSVQFHSRIPNIYLTLLGFVLSLVWVTSLASCVIHLVKLIGRLTHISEAFLGLTVVALGNSLGDLVSNVSLAKLSYSTMALAASYASPLVTILLGLGASSLLAMHIQGSRQIEITVSPNILASGAFLVAILLVLLVFIPTNNWSMTPRLGYVTLSLWALSVLTNLYIGAV